MSFRIVIVDDSALVRRAVKDILLKIPGVEICGEANDGSAGIELIRSKKPDLAILDVEMPVVNGFGVLSSIKSEHMKLHVIMLSGLTQNGAWESAKALELGAVDVIPKPDPSNGLGLADVAKLLTDKVSAIVQSESEPVLFYKEHQRGKIPSRYENVDCRILVIGSSTGGPSVVHSILDKLPSWFPVPILIVQHMPPIFTKAFADRLNDMCKIKVKEASEGEPLLKGNAYVAPGNWHLVLKKDEKNKKDLLIHLSDADARNSHRPSIDVTLESVMEHFKGNAAAVILTGMGRDGAVEMKKLYDLGGLTLAQDEESSVIFGMNKQAIEMGGIVSILSPEEIAKELVHFFQKKVA